MCALVTEGKRDPSKACLQNLMFMSRLDRNLGVAFQTHLGVRPRLEGKQRTLLVSRGSKGLCSPLESDGYVLEPTEWLKGSQTSSGVWREDTGLLSR